jgi:hypothetical protein
MNKLTKILIGTGVVVTGGYLLKMSRTPANLETEIKAKIHKLDLSGITVRVDAKIKNPSEGSLNIKYPFVKLSFKGSTVGSSQAIDQDITIPKFGEANIEAILINIPLINLLSVAVDVVKSIKNGGGIKIGIKVITTINTAFSSFPYEFEQEQIVKK